MDELFLKFIRVYPTPALQEHTPFQNKRVGPKNFRKNFKMMLHFTSFILIGASTR
jgi:hypothetical protein